MKKGNDFCLQRCIAVIFSEIKLKSLDKNIYKNKNNVELFILMRLNGTKNLKRNELSKRMFYV